MIVDTSALMTIVIGEDGWQRFGDALAKNPGLKISAGTWVEIAAVMTRRSDPTVEAGFARLFHEFSFQIIPVSVEQARIGNTAYRQFGRGSGHPAHLNFGDCFAYALAKDFGEPLLFKGEDFLKTDITSAL